MTNISAEYVKTFCTNANGDCYDLKKRLQEIEGKIEQAKKDVEEYRKGMKSFSEITPEEYAQQYAELRAIELTIDILVHERNALGYKIEVTNIFVKSCK